MSTNDQIHSEAMTRWGIAQNADSEERSRALDDARFVEEVGGQWGSRVSKKADRPRYEVDKITPALNGVIGDQLQNRSSIKVRPAGGTATQKLAETYNGIIRHIENRSHFKKVTGNAFKEITKLGIGGWYVTTRYENDTSFDQEIIIKSIYSAASSVYFDPSAPDIEDAQYCFVIRDISKESYQKQFPDKPITDITQQDRPYLREWSDKDTVRIADYWVKEPVTKELIKLSDGRIIELTKDVKKVLDELAAEGITVKKRRKVKSHKVIYYKINGLEVLEGPHTWNGKYIPVVLTYGFHQWIDNQHFFRGMVQKARDPQTVYNYLISAMVEAAALAPKNPYWITPTQAEGYERELQTYNITKKPFLFYNHDPQEPGPPKRAGPIDLHEAYVYQAQQADLDIQATTGRYAPSLGQNPDDQSGRAILAQQRQGDVGTFELTFNLTNAIEYTGEILIDLIPKIYDTERQVRILAEDHSSEFVTVNQTVIDRQTGKKVILNDLSQGQYDVVASSGPSYNTKRVEALNYLSRLSESSPLFAQVSADLMAKNVDFHFSEELTKRLRRAMIAQGLIPPNEEEAAELAAQQPPIDPVAELEAIKKQLENELLAAQINEKNVDTQLKQVQMQEKRVDMNETYEKTQSIKADTNKTLAETAEKTGVGVVTISRAEQLSQQLNLETLNQSYIPPTPQTTIPPEIQQETLMEDETNNLGQ